MFPTPEDSTGPTQDARKATASRVISKKAKKKRTILPAPRSPAPSDDRAEAPSGALDELIALRSPTLLPPEVSPPSPPPLADLTDEPERDDISTPALYDPPVPDDISLGSPAPYHPSPRLNGQPGLLVALEDPPADVFSPVGSPPWHDERATAGDPVMLSASPPRGRSRPSSRHQAYDVRAEGSGHGTPRTIRRASMRSHRPPQSSPPNPGSYPPLPHLPQAHFYSAPNVDFVGMRKRGRGLPLPEGDQFYSFDTLAIAGGDGSESIDNVLLVGGEGNLDVFRVDKEKLGVLGRLHGLRGKIVGAKILPRMAVDDTLQDHRPLVALVIHGPESPQTSAREQEPVRPIPVHSPYELAPSGSPVPSYPVLTQDDGHNRGARHYQTTVEIFSLKTRERVAVLFSSPRVQAQSSLTSLSPSPPPPIGNLRVDANGKHLIIASGSSGEVYLFGPDHEWPRDQDRRFPFRCLGKIWTAVHPHLSVGFSGSATSSEASTPSGDVGNGEPSLGHAVVSLSHRWLAYVPAKPSSHPSMEGRPLLADVQTKPPGLLMHTAPPQPQVTCAVDLSEKDSLISRMTREVTQEVIKGAKWVGDQGRQAFWNYWNRPTHPDSSVGFDGLNQGRETTQSHQPLSAQFFPPTHAHGNFQSQSASEPALVSILDLGRFDKGYDAPSPQRLQPIATFQAPLGCSFVSFAPSGLQLLTASTNGDVQFIWDLMKMVPDRSMMPPHTQGSNSKGVPGGAAAVKGPHVREINRFTRNTAANIVDVVWKSPTGEGLAVLTEKGTVHMFDIPLTAFQWPPPRRTSRSSKSPARTEEDPSPHRPLYAVTGAAGHAVSAAVKVVNSKAQPLFAAARGRRSSSGAGVGVAAPSNVAPASNASKSLQGTRIVAQGLSKSLGAATETLNTLRSIGENRLHIPRNGFGIRPGCVRWLTGRETGSISLVGGGVVRIHHVRVKAPAGKGSKRQSLVASHVIEIAVPDLSERPASASHAKPLAVVDDDAGDSYDLGTAVGYWNPRSAAGLNRGGVREQVHPLSYAEIETNSPYQPFHTDRRVGLFTYEGSAQQMSDGASSIPGLPSSDAWVFGQDIAANMVNLGGAQFMEPQQEDEVFGPMENILHRGKNSEAMEQLVITTRRRRRAKDGNGGHEDGFFEDDCEVLDFASNRV